MRSAFLKIYDKTNYTEISRTYNFIKVTNYKTLLKDLPKLYTKIKSNVEITFMYNLEIIDDLNKYILPNDQIFIKIVKAYPIYVLYDVISENQISSSKNISDLYNFYLNILYDEIDCELLLYKKVGNTGKLLDVLDSPIHHKNKCINRLIKKYNY